MDETMQTLNELLVDLFNHILLLEENYMAENNVNLSMTEVHILEAIKKSNSNMMSAVAKRLMVTQGTLTTSINRLVKKGYVERYKDESDRRIVRLTLTKQADAVLAIHDRFHEQMIDSMIDKLHLDEQKQLLQSIQNVMEFFRKEY